MSQPKQGKPTPPGHSPPVQPEEMVQEETLGNMPEEQREHAVAGLLGFCALNQACRLYDMNNEVVRRVLEEMLSHVQALSGGLDPVTLTCAGHSFFLNRTLVRMGYSEFQKAHQLKGIWQKLGITEVIFPPDVTLEGMEEFAHKFIETIKDPSLIPEFTRRPWGGVTAHMVLGGSNEAAVATDDQREELVCALAVRVYGGLMMLVMETLEQFQQDRWTTLTRIKRTLQVLVDKLEHHEGLLVALVCTPIYRETLAAHLTNTAILTLIMGRRLKLSRPNLIALATAALFHDISKVGLKAPTLNVLEHFANLEPTDRQRIHMHWMNTLSRLVHVGGFSRETLARLVAGYESQLEFSHGTLYPKTMELPRPHSLYAHLISLCDRFDNLAWGRPGKPALSPHRAMLTVLHQYSRSYHPSLLNLFANTVGLYPTGSLVRLNSGELAVVTGQDPDGNLECPTVTLISEPTGEPVSDGTEINLAMDRTRQIRSSEDANALGVNPIAPFLRWDIKMKKQGAGQET